MVGRRQVRQRIAAKNRWLVWINEQPQNYKLPRLAERNRPPIDGGQNEGSYTIALLIDTGDSHLSKTRPCRRLCLIGKSRIPQCSFRIQGLLQHCLERTLPALAQSRN